MREAFKVRFQPSGHQFEVASGKAVLEAALEQDYKIPHACDNGVCHVCSAVLHRGELENDPLVNVTRKGAAQVLLCRARPTSDCEFELNALWGPKELETNKLAMQVKSIESLSADIFRVTLLAPAGRLPEFFAGQYLKLLIPGLDSAFFSIANAPGGREIELHIQVHPDQQSAVTILSYLRDNPVVKVMLPLGQCHLSSVPDTDVVLVAAGTGFAQMKSLAEYLLNNGFSGNITLYWGVRQREEMYLRKWMEEWAAQTVQLTFVPVSADNQDNEWPGHHAELVREVLARGHTWDNSLIFVSGSPTMVYTALDALTPVGLPTQHFFSDVLEYAPR
ncbi:CDP-6-deoxy-delta-3,4-glucoseen reductase [Hahella sp. CCB-MM4]|uniref:2Fe-2S iron-sulfur cluster-binding protein n=1 Tax=Hahella sp. (strain CCB-MM4) TaxID=1926491 RepID=UPI000B9B1BD5|nr:2Fe-2S iron-sulfur cluster-binding protein [Hahella sp. CCB-MM4]OZG74641.1 CDP-6-deoxy-delta-3,4-glucoseen reductase [Hahella sp. CCB-MM4]